MKLSISEPLSDSSNIFYQWVVTPEVIVVLLGSRESPTHNLQARNWEGKQLWQIDIAEVAPWGLAVGDDFVFLGSKSGAIQEFDLSSGV